MFTPFPTIIDLQLLHALVKDMSDRFFPLIRYKRLNKNATVIDPVHREVRETSKQFYDEIDVRAFPIPEDEKLPLTKFALEELRNVTFQISVPSLLEAGLIIQDGTTMEITLLCGIGDRMFHSYGLEYEVLSVKRGKMFGSTDIPLYYLFVTERFREDADITCGIICETGTES